MYFSISSPLRDASHEKQREGGLKTFTTSEADYQHIYFQLPEAGKALLPAPVPFSTVNSLRLRLSPTK